MPIMRGERAPKKRGFSVKVFSKKCLQLKTIFWSVCSKFCLRRTKFCQNRVLKCFGTTWKINLVDLKIGRLKKGRQIFRNFYFFSKISPPPHDDKTPDQPLGRSFRFLEMLQTILKTLF